MDTDDQSLSNDWSAGGQTGASTVNDNLTGDVGLVTSSGSKSITWTWDGTGTGLASTDQVRVRVYHIMKYPVTNWMYVDFLNEVGNDHDNTADADHDYWNSTQSDNTRGGVDVSGSIPNATWSITSGRDDWPVIGVNFLNSYDMCRWMGLVPPTEEQWELACRSVGGAGGNTYSWGDNPVPSTNNCNMDGTFVPGAPSDVNYFETTWEDSSMANPDGIFEMTGNVWEWCDTESYSGAYDDTKSGLTYASPPTNVINRGGSWGVSGTYLYGSSRALTATYNGRYTFIGIRAVKN
jgi:formylglycine-generating enzyme required for sulfatase activity